MAAVATSAQLQKLEALESGFRTDTVAHDGGFSTVRCWIVHKKTGEWWCSGEGHDEQSALEAAIANAGSAEKPRTVADIAKENEELKLQIAQAKTEGDIKPRPKRSKPKQADNPIKVDPEQPEVKPLPKPDFRESATK